MLKLPPTGPFFFPSSHHSPRSKHLKRCKLSSLLRCKTLSLQVSLISISPHEIHLFRCRTPPSLVFFPPLRCPFHILKHDALVHMKTCSFLLLCLSCLVVEITYTVCLEGHHKLKQGALASDISTLSLLPTRHLANSSYDGRLLTKFTINASTLVYTNYLR